MGHGLFDVDMFAGVESIHRHLEVPVFRGSDQNPVDVLVVEETAVFLNWFSAGKLGGFVEALVVDVTDVHDFEVVSVAVLHHGFHVIGCHAAGADNADAQPVIRARNRR